MLRPITLVTLVAFLSQPCLADPPKDVKAQKAEDALKAQIEPNNVSVFMQSKLHYAQKVLEGLATEDYRMIDRNSQELSLLSLAATWQVFQTPEYLRNSAEFRRTSNGIRDAAKKKNLEAATLSYMEMTMKCVRCHQHVRSIKTAALPSISSFQFVNTKEGN